MITGAKNKTPVRGEAATKEPSELQEYHFPGGLEYEPATIRAHSREEAENEWRRIRRPIPKTKVENQGNNE